jgi:hypothetical protein
MSVSNSTDGAAGAVSGAAARPDARLRQVFISVKSEERQAAAHLAAALEARGIQAWWADKIENGSYWQGRIGEALAASGAVVVLWSKAAMRSDWVKHEASQAMARGVYVPARIEAMDLQTPFEAIQATDVPGLLQNPRPTQMDNLIEAIEKVLPPPRGTVLRFIHGVVGQRALLAAVAFAVASTGALGWLAWTAQEQVKALTGITGQLETTQGEAERVAGELRQTQDAVKRVVDQVEAIFSADLDWAYVLGMDAERRGFLRIENLGAGIATIEEVSVTSGGKTLRAAGPGASIKAADLYEFGKVFGLGANTIKVGQKIPPGRGIQIYSIPARFISDKNERCIADQRLKAFFDSLDIRVRYKSTFDPTPREAHLDYANQNRLTCIR